MIQTQYSLAEFKQKIEFPAENYAVMIKQENEQVNEIKSKQPYFLLKYCSLTFLNFYI